MRKNLFAFKHLSFGACLLYFLWSSVIAHSQQLSFKDIAIFGSTSVELSSGTNVNGGSVVSKLLIKTTGNAILGSDLHSRGRIELAKILRRMKVVAMSEA